MSEIPTYDGPGLDDDRPLSEALQAQGISDMNHISETPTGHHVRNASIDMNTVSVGSSNISETLQGRQRECDELRALTDREGRSVTSSRYQPVCQRIAARRQMVRRVALKHLLGSS
jgi:hypothetical protein